MKKKYDLINEKLEEYAKKYENTFFYQNARALMNLAYNFCVAINGKIDWSKEIDKSNQKLDLFSSLDIVQGFLKELGPEYLDKFEEGLKNGIISFSDKTDDNIYDDRASYAFIYIESESHKGCNVALEYNYSDPPKIVHEFFHTLSNYDKQLNFTDISSSLTEFISIYMENKCFDYMEERGFEKSELAKCKLYRIEDTYKACEAILTYNKLSILFENYGRLDDNAYDFSNQYSSINFWDTKDAFNKNINKVYNDFQTQKEANPNFASRYILCEVLTNYIRMTEDEETTKKVLKLSDSLPEQTSITSALNIISVNIDDPSFYKKTREAIEKNVEKIADDLNNSKKL